MDLNQMNNQPIEGKQKLGRPAEYFPSGLTAKDVAEAIYCDYTLVNSWRRGLPIADHKKPYFYQAAGFESDDDWQRWLSTRKNTKQITKMGISSMSKKPKDLITRHAEITSRIASTEATISKIEQSIEAPTNVADIDKALAMDQKNRADLIEENAVLSKLKAILAETNDLALDAADTMDREYDAAHAAWKRERAAELTDLLKSDESKQVRDFIARAQWLYKVSGQDRYTELRDSGEWTSSLTVSDEIAEAAAKKGDIYEEFTKWDGALFTQLKELPMQGLANVGFGSSTTQAEADEVEARRLKVRALQRQMGRMAI